MNKKTQQIDFKRTPAAHHKPLAKAKKLALSLPSNWKPLILIGVGLTIAIFLGGYLLSGPSHKNPPEPPKIKTITIPLPPITEQPPTKRSTS